MLLTVELVLYMQVLCRAVVQVKVQNSLDDSFYRSTDSSSMLREGEHPSQ